jgi:hypothetical protein
MLVVHHRKHMLSLACAIGCHTFCSATQGAQQQTQVFLLASQLSQIPQHWIFQRSLIRPLFQLSAARIFGNYQEQIFQILVTAEVRILPLRSMIYLILGDQLKEGVGAVLGRAGQF